MISALIGREDSNVFGPENREEARWIGKPWRRVELVTRRHFWKGEQVDVGRELSLHLGIRRFGFAMTLTLLKQGYLDYSDEPNQ